MKSNFEGLRVYQLAESLSDAVWELVLSWDRFARDTVGRQLVRAADSVGANIAEGSGRGSGSLNETQHFLRRAFRRKLIAGPQIKRIKPLLDELAPSLNAYLSSIGTLRCGTGLPRSAELQRERPSATGN